MHIRDLIAALARAEYQHGNIAVHLDTTPDDGSIYRIGGIVKGTSSEQEPVLLILAGDEEI